MTQRLFAAIVPPPHVMDALARWIEPRRDADDAVRWLPERNWHITLAFFGDVIEPDIDPLTDSLREAAAAVAPFAVAIRGAGAFPDITRARVLWQGVHADTLNQLAGKLRTAADRVGVPPDGAKFRPHLTLARTHRPIEATRWLRVIDAFDPQDWRVEACHLVRSTLRRGGSVYEIVDSFVLRPPLAERALPT